MSGAVSADCDVMWQIGVDTLAGYRDRGIGKALVSVLTENLMKRKILPYYGTAVSNVVSRRTAIHKLMPAKSMAKILMMKAM